MELAPVSGPTSRDMFGASETSPSLSLPIWGGLGIGSKSVQVRFDIGSISDRNRFEIGSGVRKRFQIGSKSVPSSVPSSVRGLVPNRFEIGSKSQSPERGCSCNFFLGSLLASVCGMEPCEFEGLLVRFDLSSEFSRGIYV